MSRVGICIPHGGYSYPSVYREVMTMEGQFPQHQFIQIEVDLMIVGKARTILVETAIAQEVDVVWFIDNDILIPAHAGVIVEQAEQLGVVSGLYFNRRPPYTPQVYKIAEEEKYQGKYWPLLDIPEGGLRREDAVGAGCLAVRTDIFETLAEYWQVQVGNALTEITGPVHDIVAGLSPWFEFLDKKGEDLYFSERLREIGQEIHVNYDVKCLHLSQVPIGDHNFKYMKDNNLIQIMEDGDG